jgi:two-component system, sensor histidine kinase
MAVDVGTDGSSLDSATLQVQQAQLLFDRARSSAIAVFTIVVLYCAILTFTAPYQAIAIWFAAATLMIFVTLVQPIAFRASGITLQNARNYLWWHTLISSITGMTWGLGGIFLTDVNDVVSVFTTSMMVLGITLGGVSPQSAYRRSYVGLATFVMLPYGMFMLLWAPWPMSATGAGVLFGYAFFMSSSARVELATRDAIAVRQNRALTEQLQVQRDELQKVSEDKTRFLAATSHDLAQPLHAQGFFLAALREKLTEPDQLDLLTKVEASWRGLGNLLDGLVDVSRLDAGAIVADQRNLDLGALTSRVAEEFSAVAAEKNVELQVRAEATYAETDPILYARVIRNLLSNAIKFTDPGGRIDVSVVSAGERVDVTIADTGCGIPVDKQDAVFGEYVQLGNRERNREKGLGLGLSIVRRLTELLQIDMSLTSEVGTGTTFLLQVPATVTSVPGGVDADLLRKDGSRTVGNLCILIVDDEDAIRSGMATLLSSWGCQVLSAGNGDDAVNLLGTEHATPDVLIVDRRLQGGETGMEVVERVRDELNEDIPVILMTGDISVVVEDIAMQSLKLLHKPVEPSLVRRLLSEIAQDKTQLDAEVF